MTVSVQLDSIPQHIPKLSACKISQFFSIPLHLVWAMTYDARFPPYEKDFRGCRRWLQSDVDEFLEGQR
jgi:hypothetical protein